MLETFYPIQEVTAYTAYNMLANLVGFLGDMASNGGLWMIVGLMSPLFFYLLFGYNTKLKRLEIEL